MSEKYIIEYLGGCRGDFLCNFLNYGNLILEDEKTSKSKTAKNNLKSLSTESRYKQQPLDYLNLKNLLQNISLQFTPSHDLNFMDRKNLDILEKYNFKIFKIIFSQKWYKNIWLECIFKSYNDFDKIETTRSDFENKLKESPPFLFYQMYNHKESNKNKILLNYEELYFNIKIEKFFLDIDIKTYKNYLKQVELKEEIELYGKKYYPSDYGYMWNEDL